MRKLLLVLAFVFMASTVFAADVDLKWDAVPGATGYKIYKSEDMGVTWATPINVGNVTSYKYLGVIETKLVLFRASAFDANGESIRTWSGAWFDYTKKPINTPSGTGIQQEEL